jgi:DNA-binding transcriptional LysR family regulator
VESIAALSAFVQAADTRSFTEAGRQLGLSASAVGKSIQRLEEQLGVRLFHRSTRTITLTQEGAIFLEHCRRILCEIDAARAEIAKSRDAPRGTLRVSLPILNKVALPALTAFMRAYPEVQLDLEFGDRLVDIIEEGFDAVIRAGDIADSRLMSRMLGAFHLKLVASPDYLALRGIPAAPDSLASHACLVHRYVTSRKFEPWPVRGGDGEIGLIPAPALIADTIEPLLIMAERGMGIACLPDLLVAEQIASGTLVTVLDDHVEHSGMMRILWPSSRHLSPKLRAFVDFMSTNMLAAAEGEMRNGPAGEDEDMR